MTTENKITPMQKLKNSFNAFNDKSKGLFEQIALNKVEEKKHYVLPYWYVDAPAEDYTKGVKSDFIKVYHLNKKYRNKESNFYCSMAFSFNFIDKKEEDESIRLSFKVKKPVKNTHNKVENVFFITDDLTVEEVREKMKIANAIIEDLNYKRTLSGEKKEVEDLYYEKLDAISVSFFGEPLMDLVESNNKKTKAIKMK